MVCNKLLQLSSPEQIKKMNELTVMNIYEAGYNHSQPWPLSPDLRRVRESTSSTHYINAISCCKHDDFESPGPAITTYSAAVEFVSLPKGVGGRLRLVSHYANSFIQEAVGLTGWLLLGWKFSGLISILFPQRISSRENLIKDQSIFPLVIMIILLFLITFSFNNVLLLSGENWYWQSWNLKG